MNDVKLRDQRKPGHCWQDNELYDAFGPVIGPNAVTVYTHMTRQCYGTEIRSSSRELAEASGLSKNTVWRAMRAMERIGMLRAVAGGPGKVAEYHLVDLKELAESHGGVFDRRRVSYVFSALQTAALKAMAAGGSAIAATVPVGDSSPIPTVPVGDSAGTQLSHQGDATVPPEGRPYTRQQDLQDNPPTPQRGVDADDEERQMRAEQEALEAKFGDLDRRLKMAWHPEDRRKLQGEHDKMGRELSRIGRALGLKRANRAPVPVETVHDPPPQVAGRRRRWTPAMVGMSDEALRRIGVK